MTCEEYVIEMLREKERQKKDLSDLCDELSAFKADIEWLLGGDFGAEPKMESAGYFYMGSLFVHDEKDAERAKAIFENLGIEVKDYRKENINEKESNT